MALPGETLASQPSTEFHHCEECYQKLIPRIMRSPAGYYIGTSCNCGPYSRESDYYKTDSEARKALKTGYFVR